ncbi:tetratricopeptide repeat protein [Limnothrix sp. FACHB-1083]|nr:tetratricopeptide repeat protein [Limnothrix sp. FACHB-1083]MBD2191406.1 tetratricopeptide repeat protein [Limnothrix sp. FACHB-1088]
MGDRIEQNHSGSGDNVARDKHVHVYPSAPPPKPTGDGPPTNLQDRGVARDRFFGRDQVLAELHQLLQKGDHRVAIASVDGMGGVGKSELAVQYARQHLHETYRGGVVWLAGERAGVELLNFARSRFFPTVDLAELGDLPEQLAYCFGHWPAQEVPPESVLLIFDDVTDYRTQVAAILPSDSRFRVLVTTRAQFQGVERLELPVLTPEAALQLLESIVGRERIAAEPKTAAALCEWLGYLPLGIELVGSLLKLEPDWSIQSVLERLKREKLRHEAMSKIEIAFNISWQQLAPAPQQLAVLLGCFGNGPIPWELVEATVVRCETQPQPQPRRQRKRDRLWQWITQKPATPLEQWCLLLNRDQLTQARRRLVELSLLERTGPEEYKLHPLIREFFAAKRADWPEGGALQQAFLGQMVSVAKTVPSTVTLADLARTRPAWPHLETAAAASGEIADDDSTWPFIALAWLAMGQGLWAEAEQHYSDCLSTTERRFGPDHPKTAASLNNLAELYRSQGRYGAAEPLFRRSLEIWERLLGADHPDTASSLNNLAELYRSQGRYETAEPLYWRSLEIWEQVLGADHPATASSLNNLALLYRFQGQYEAAEPLYRRSLEIRERLLGADHPDTATSLNNLAELYRLQGRYEAAEPLYQRSLEIRERVLGADHPHTAQSLNNLANLYAAQGRYETAEPLLRRALEVRERVMGADHPDTAQSLNNLAVLHYHQNRWGEAERLLLRALEIRVQKLGEAHPDTQGSIQSLYGLVQATLQQGCAAELSDHPLTQSILQQLTTRDG